MPAQSNTLLPLPNWPPPQFFTPSAFPKAPKFDKKKSTACLTAFETLRDYLKQESKFTKGLSITAASFSAKISKGNTKRMRKLILDLLDSESDTTSFTKKLGQGFYLPTGKCTITLPGASWSKKTFSKGQDTPDVYLNFRCSLPG